jgi:hypothetical protein
MGQVETFNTIAAWAQETFGPQSTMPSIAARANKELAELMALLVQPNPPSRDEVCDECADVAIVLARYVVISGIDQQWLDRKVAEEAYHQHHIVMVSDIRLAANSAGMLAGLVAGHDSPSGLAFILANMGTICQRHGRQLAHAIDAKMIVNRARKWRLDGNGHGQHVEESGPDYGTPDAPA